MKKVVLTTILLLSSLYAEESVEELDKVEVEGGGNSLFDVPTYFERPNYLENAPAQQRLTVKEAMSLPGVMSDPLKALQSLAGVSSPSSFSGELLIHGSKAYETFYTYNYMPLGYTFHLGGIHSVISPDAIEQLNVYLGAFDVTYGNAMGGVIDITPKFPTGSNNGNVHVGLFDASGSIDYKINDQLSLYIGGRRSYYDIFLNIFNPQFDGFSIDTYPNYYDLTTILAYVPNDENIITFESIVAKDTTDLTKSVVSVCNPDFVGEASTLQMFRTYGIRWKYDNLDNFQSNTVFAYTAKKDKTDVFNQIKSEENFHDIKLNNTSTLTLESHKIATGFEVTNYYHPYNYQLPASFLSDAEYSGSSNTTNYVGEQNFQNLAVFLQDIYSINENIKLRYGLRGNYTPYQSFGVEIDPRVALIYELPNQSISFATGQYSQYPVLSRAISEFSSGDLQYEKSVHFSLNYKYKFSDKHSFEIEPFHKEYTSLSVSDGSGKYVMGTSSILNGIMQANGLGYSQGVDFTYKNRGDNYFVFVTYSYLNANRLYTQGSSLEMFTDEIPHTAQISASYDIGYGWIIAGLGRYRNGIMYSKPTSYITTTTTAGTCYKSNPATEVKERLPDYFSLNLKATKTNKLTKNRSWEYSFELMNVTAHKNISGYRVDSETGVISESYDVLSFPFLPWFDVTYRF